MLIWDWVFSRKILIDYYPLFVFQGKVENEFIDQGWKINSNDLKSKQSLSASKINDSSAQKLIARPKEIFSSLSLLDDGICMKHPFVISWSPTIMK